ncbi:hypothetical protein [Hymenobacter sp.]|jgi:hypothetical protein|uniref:hypothetical protein n=1 Tax=Hymenobacter sp. TaxID=1898978 RepID=UPI002ED80FF6
MKRKLFLEAFFGALGAKKVLWTDFQLDKVYGTVVYDPTDQEERQDFIWHMNESNVPSDDVRKLLWFLSENNLMDIDKIAKPIDELNIDFIEKNKLESVWNDLFDIEVRMIDDGEETDRYFIHD